MCFIFRDSVFDGLVGYSPIAMAKNAIGMAIACEEVRRQVLRQWRDSRRCLGTPPGTIKDPQRVRKLADRLSVAVPTPTKWLYWKKE